MESLIAHVIIATSTYAVLPEEIINATLNHLDNVESIGLITADATPWLAHLWCPLIVWNNWNVYQNQAVAAYIVDVRAENNWSIQNLRSLRRIAATRFVIITNVEDEQQFSGSVSKIGLCNVLIIAETNEETKVLKTNDLCGGPGQEIVEDPDIGLSHCLINASYMDIPPLNLYENSRMGGWEGSILQTATDYLSMEVYWTNRHESGWEELLQDAKEGSLALGAVYAFHSRWQKTELIASCFPVTIAFVAPINAGKMHPTWFIILVSELSPTVWITTLLTYLFLVLFAWVFNDSTQPKIDILYTPFHIIALILGTTQNFILQRAYTITIIYFGFMITIYYQAVMSSKLTAPGKPTEIRNWQEILETNWEIKGTVPMKIMLKSMADAYPANVEKQEVYKRYVPDLGILMENLQRVVRKRDMVYARTTSNTIYVSNMDAELAGKFHIVEEPLITYLPNTMMPKHSCLAERFQYTYYRICGSGLASKWFKDLNTIVREAKETSVKQLSVAHIKGFLFLLIFGWFLATAAFLLEILFEYMQKKRARTRTIKNTLFMIRNNGKLL